MVISYINVAANFDCYMCGLWVIISFWHPQLENKAACILTESHGGTYTIFFIKYVYEYSLKENRERRAKLMSSSIMAFQIKEFHGKTYIIFATIIC